MLSAKNTDGHKETGFGSDGGRLAVFRKAHAGAPLHGQGAPWGADGSCAGLPELAQGWRERRRRQSLHNLLCKSGSEGRPSGATLAARSPFP
jgi:hypothetical protein